MARRKASEMVDITEANLATDQSAESGDTFMLSFVIDPDSTVPIHYANQLTVQQVDGMSLLSFFQTVPPILMGNTEEQITRLKEMKPIPATCVGRIMIAPGRLPEFARVLAELVERLRDGG